MGTGSEAGTTGSSKFQYKGKIESNNWFVLKNNTHQSLQRLFDIYPGQQCACSGTTHLSNCHSIQINTTLFNLYGGRCPSNS